MITGPPALWGTLFVSTRDTYIVLADATFTLVQDLTRLNLNLADYLEPGFGELRWRDELPTETADTVHGILPRQDATIGNAQIGSRLARLPGIPANRANPWLELFQTNLTFRFGYDPRLRKEYVQCAGPTAARYLAGGQDGRNDEIYSVVALTPNLDRSGFILMLGGTGLEGTEAKRIADQFRARNGPGIQPFEILLKSSKINRTSWNTTVIASRWIPVG